MTPDIKKIIATALKEDASSKDITTDLLIPKDHTCTAYVVAKETGILCGIEIAEKVYQRMTPKVKFKILHRDGTKISSQTKVARITGNTRVILKGERTALNFMMHLSGVATLTQQFVRTAGNPKVKILDTRKTTPGLRQLEKYAVRCGGGTNHRMNLSDMVLIKDNHLAALRPTRSIIELLRNVKKRTKKTVEVEVTSLQEFKHACKAAPDLILLDNMKPSCMKSAVLYLKQRGLGRKIQLEASGGITLKNIKTVARTGVDRISIGALTHSAKAINMSLEIAHIISKGTPILPLKRGLLKYLIVFGLLVLTGSLPAQAQSEPSSSPSINALIFSDKLLLDGYSSTYISEPKDVIIAMIQDDTLSDYKMAASVRVFRTQYCSDLFSREKKAIEKILIRRLNRTNSIFVEVEIMHTLCVIDRYKYFDSMVPLLVQKLDHYNKTVNEIAYDGVNDLVKNQNRPREARIIFNTLRKNLFLSRRRLSNIKEPDNKLKLKLSLLRWSIKILGTEELERLPKEVIPLL